MRGAAAAPVRDIPRDGLGSAQIPVGRQLQQFANIDHKAAWPAATASIHSPGATSTCSPFCSSPQREAEKPRIFMGADALAALGLLLAGVADQPDMLVGFRRRADTESILRELQGFGKGAAGRMPTWSSAVASEVTPA